ncbi:MAG TPA: GNAT family N-acetyltransferase [Thermoanaerobaculia bacterium]|nr:GNAT family N-acetyltransferase [Thermoanaerobaculia bacterium]
MTRARVTVERFTGEARGPWDDFVRDSRNGTFLFLRDYMEYHRDRFEDHSLIVRDVREQGTILALLPASRRGDVLDSHGGLTYGGIVSNAAMTAPKMLEAFDAILEHLRQESFTRLRYRAVPHIYHRAPAEEDLYALARHGASLVHRTVLSVLDSRHPVAAQERRRRGVRKALAAGLACRETDDLEAYWSLLTRVLQETYGARPVHSLAEIELLRWRFPRNIRLFGCFQGASLVAGVVVYESPTVARAQYIAASQAGKDLAALDLLFHVLLREVYPDKPYFDLGTSESADGRDLNRGVLEFKESLGARTVVVDTYELQIPT